MPQPIMSNSRPIYLLSSRSFCNSCIVFFIIHISLDFLKYSYYWDKNFISHWNLLAGYLILDKFFREVSSHWLISLINPYLHLLNLVEVRPYLYLKFSLMNDWQRTSSKLCHFLADSLQWYYFYEENRMTQWRGWYVCLSTKMTNRILHEIQIKHETSQNKMNLVICNETSAIFFK